MNKSVYSLVLMDKIVEQIDKLAYQANTNRSGMINSILADFVSMVTPETISNRIYDRLRTLIEKNTQFIIQPGMGNSTILLKSALNYKYNPIIRYSVELYGGVNSELGCVKVGVRTQNQLLKDMINDFFEMFCHIENNYIDFGDLEFHVISDGKLRRRLIVPKNSSVTEAMLGEAISLYLDNLDKALKIYFSCAPDSKKAYLLIDEVYSKYLKKQTIII